MNLRALRTSVRLALGFGAVLAILAIVVIVSSILISQSKQAMVAGLDQANTKAQYANTMRAALLEKGIAMRNIGLQSEVGAMQAAEEQVKAHHARYQETLGRLAAAGLTETEKAILAEIARIDEAMAGPFGDALAHALGFDTEQAAMVITGQLEPLNQKAVEQINELVRAQSAATRAVLDASLKDDRELMVILYAMGALALAVGAIMAWLTARSITNPLERAVRVAARVAEGDLTARIEDDGRDEIAQLFVALRQMNDSLLKTVSQVRHGTDAIASASAEIARGNLDLSTRTEQQAGSLEETAASMEELTSTVKNNLDNARQANTLASSASGVASRGGAVVSDVVQTMGAINESARKIVDIIGVIDGIAFQTNILALNAAVEAARAGEQGRGFAVVASEVRSLAQRSAAAAKEIKSLIDDSVTKVKHGNTLVGQAGATMNEVVESVKRVTDIMAEIMAASEEQSSGIEQVNQAIGHMDQVTQQNAALVEEAAAASAAMQDQARQLASVVSVFRLSEGAGSPPRTAEQSPRLQAPALPARSVKTALVAKRKAPALRNTSAHGDWEEF